MKITAIECFLVAPRWMFCKISTDEGVSGWGEPVVEGSAEAVRAMVEIHAEYLIGQDPLLIEHHWQVMTKGTFYRGGAVFASAVSGIDQALWDIAGKVHGVPVHDLLGGAVRDKVRTYGHVGGEDPAALADAVAEYCEVTGQTALKMTGTERADLVVRPAEAARLAARAEAVREVLGPDRDFAVDFHGRVTRPSAPRLIAALEPYQPMFVEEALLPDAPAEGFAELRAQTAIPLATGERLYSRTDFRPVLENGITIVQPDLSHAGGISECRRIAAQAETYGAVVAPHCPLGPIALAACLQLDLASPNALIQEHSMGISYHAGHAYQLGYLVDVSVLAITDGHIARLTGPGLGIEIDEAAVRRAAEQPHRWRGPAWRHPDGSFAEW